MRRALAILICLAGCGGSTSNQASFNGTFSGGVVFNNDCQGSSMPAAPASPKLTLTLAQQGSKLSITGLSCPVTADISGTQATIEQNVCPKDMKGNTLGYPNGTLILEGDTLVVNIFTNDLLADGTVCNGTIEAPLASDTSGNPNPAWNPYQ